MKGIAQERYIVSAIADVDVIVYADTIDEAREIGLRELRSGVTDAFYLSDQSVEVDLLEWEDEA